MLYEVTYLLINKQVKQILKYAIYNFLKYAAYFVH